MRDALLLVEKREGLVCMLWRNCMDTQTHNIVNKDKKERKGERKGKCV